MVTAAKTTSQIVVHMGVAFAVMYAFTGSVAFGGMAALIEPVCNVAIMPLHEKLWERIRARIEAKKATGASVRPRLGGTDAAQPA
jgi:uncharacterized membrane protein